jgi:magnesium transporter
VNHYSTEIHELLGEDDQEGLKEILDPLSPFEVADIITRKNEQEQSILFHLLNPEQQEHTFEFLPVWVQKNLLMNLPPVEAAKLLSHLSPDDRTNFLQEIPRETIDELIKLLPAEEGTLTLALLGYPEGSVGRLMTPDYLAVKKDWTVENVLDHIREFGEHCETVDNIYVVDDEGYLLDEIPLKEFIFAPKHKVVEALVGHPSVTLLSTSRDESAIKIFRDWSRSALPVVDEKGMLLGIVTIDDILRLSNEEATEDIQKLGGLAVLDEPYLQAPFLELMKKRVGWLIALFLGEMFTATARGYFEEEIAKAVVLALFLPLIISSGGNAGSQATTLVIRAMALGEVKIQDWWKIVRLEVYSGLFLGTILGFIGFIRVAAWGAIGHTYGEHWFLIAMVVGISLVGVVLWGTLSGATFPLILRRFGVDPATASAPFVATVVDVTGVVIYFLISIFILSGTLL